MIKPIHRWLLLGLFVLSLGLFALGNHGLLEPDEGRYANIALEWTEFYEHDWLEPMLSDVGHYDKPPLIYWITGSSFLAFGQSEFSARFPSLLGGLLTLLGAGLIAWRHYGERSAFWTVLVCATSFHFWALSHLLSPDMLLCGFCTLGASLTLWGGKSKKGLALWFVGVLFWSLAWWTKATAALVPLGAITAALLITRNRTLIQSLCPIRLFFMILLLGSPWYIIMIQRHTELWDFFFVREIAGRVAGHADGRKGFPGFHFAVAAAFWLPWWPVALFQARKKFGEWKHRNWRTQIQSIPWEIWAAFFVVGIYSLVSSKLITYTLPGLPFLTVYIGNTLSKTEISFRKWPLKIAAFATIIILAIGFTIPKIENDLKRNSSVREAIEFAKSNGAHLIIMDDYWPGAEFYFDMPI